MSNNKKIGLADKLRVNKPKKNIEDLVSKLHGDEKPKLKLEPTQVHEDEKPESKLVPTQAPKVVTKKKVEDETVKTSIHYPKSLYRDLKVLCAQEGMTLKDYIMDLIKKDLKKRK